MSNEYISPEERKPISTRAFGDKSDSDILFDCMMDDKEIPEQLSYFGQSKAPRTKEDQYEYEQNKNKYMLAKRKNEIEQIKAQPCQQYVSLDLNAIQAQFNEIQDFNKMLISNLEPRIDFNFAAGTTTVTILKPGLEKIQTLTKNIIKYEFLDEILTNDGKTGEFKVKTTCILSTHQGQKMSEGDGVCSTHESKMYYEYKDKADIERRFKTRGIKDHASGEYIPVEELEEVKGEYKVPKSVAALKELSHTAERKASIRASRAAINNFLAGSSLLPELKKKLQNRAGEKVNANDSHSQFTCEKCGKEMKDNKYKRCYSCNKG